MECKCNQPNYQECNGHQLCVNCGMFKPQQQQPTGNFVEELTKVLAKVQGLTVEELLANAMREYCNRKDLSILENQFEKLLTPEQSKSESQPSKQPLEYARELKAQGVSYNGIANRFNKEGLTQPNGKEWYPTAIVRLLAKTTTVQTAKQLAKQLREQGMSYGNIAVNLNKRGFARPNGTKWYAMVVSELLK